MEFVVAASMISHRQTHGVEASYLASFTVTKFKHMQIITVLYLWRTLSVINFHVFILRTKPIQLYLTVVLFVHAYMFLIHGEHHWLTNK